MDLGGKQTNYNNSTPWRTTFGNRRQKEVSRGKHKASILARAEAFGPVGRNGICIGVDWIVSWHWHGVAGMQTDIELDWYRIE